MDRMNMAKYQVNRILVFSASIMLFALNALKITK
jgi:hypothetical protein